MSAQKSTADLNKIRNAFMQRVSAPSVPHAAFKLAWLIAYRYMNRESRTTFVAQDTLAADLNVSIRTVQRLLDILERLGLRIALGHGPNRASTYWIEPAKATPLSPINTTPVSPIEGGKGDIRRQNRRQPVQEKATPVSPLLKKKYQKEEPRRKKDPLALRARERDSAPVFFPGIRSKRTREEGRKRASPNPRPSPGRDSKDSGRPIRARWRRRRRASRSRRRSRTAPIPRR